MHITLGVISYTYADLLKEAFENIDDDAFFRKSVPRNTDNAYFQKSSDFPKYLYDYIKNIDFDLTIKKARDRFINTRLPDSTDRLKDYLNISMLTSKTKLKKRKSTFYDLKFSENQIELRFNNKSIKFPIIVEGTIKFILAADIFSVEEITGILDVESNILFCKKLVEEGFLTIIP